MDGDVLVAHLSVVKYYSHPSYSVILRQEVDRFPSIFSIAELSIRFGSEKHYV